MNNFDLIYKILRILEKAMDVEEFDKTLISADALKISEKRWCSIIEMMIDNKYVKGVSVKYSLDGIPMVSMGNIRITLQGLEYLEKNSAMRKAADIAKGIKETIPGTLRHGNTPCFSYARRKMDDTAKLLKNIADELRGIKQELHALNKNPKSRIVTNNQITNPIPDHRIDITL